MKTPATRIVAVPALALFGAVVVIACGDDGSATGTACGAPADCYPDVEQSDIKGEVTCLDRVPDGYCTHTCAADADCCAIEGECADGHAEVCSPLESTGQTYCFLSCEASDVGDQDPNEYCQEFAGRDFTCRSTGGGSANRKVCLI